jgi:integrase
MAHFASQPADLTLKSVWYCTREELKVTYMRYNDALAIQLFSNKNRTLSDLKLCDATEERIMEALQLVVPESEADPQYKRLLDFIFRVAVKRGFLKSNPFKPTKTSLDHDRKKAMRQLRDALTKEALEDDQLFKILKFLLEPIGKTNTPRAVKKSIWLVPLIRMCTGMPLREICALRWKDFQQIDDLDAYQFRVTHLLNDFGEVVPMTTYQYAKQYRRVPCVTLLTHVLLQRQKYLQDNYRIFSHEAQEQPIIYFEEPNTPHVGRKKATMYCSIPQARKVSVQALQKANIPSKVIPLLDGEASFVEDLNATRNDLFYANFIHQANWFCGLSESELCYIIGRCAPSCYGGHYVDFENDFMQLDMIQRLDRLWYKVCQAWQKAAEYHHTTIESGESHTYVALPSAGQFASADLHIAHVAGSDTGEIFIRIESDHGADVKISAIP